MTTEQKQLLIKDLCARLSYGVMCDILGHPLKLIGIHPNKKFTLEFDRGEYMPTDYMLEDVEPYLRPMSSMTEEEKIVYDKTFAYFKDIPCYTLESFDWLNAHHFDYRGLIEKGLALPAPDGMYNFK